MLLFSDDYKEKGHLFYKNEWQKNKNGAEIRKINWMQGNVKNDNVPIANECSVRKYLMYYTV